MYCPRLCLPARDHAGDPEGNTQHSKPLDKNPNNTSSNLSSSASKWPTRYISKTTPHHRQSLTNTALGGLSRLCRWSVTNGKQRNMQHAGKNCAKASTPKLVIKCGIVL